MPRRFSLLSMRWVLYAVYVAVVVYAADAWAVPGWHSSARRPAAQRTLSSPETQVTKDMAGEAVFPKGPPEVTIPEVDKFVDVDDKKVTGVRQDRDGTFVLTVDDCIRLVQERGRLIKAADMDIEAARRKVDEASALFWPVLEYKYRMAPVPRNVDDAFNSFFDGNVTLFNSLHVGIGVPLSTFGQLTTAKRMAKGGVEAARVNEYKARQTAVYQVKKLYYGILLAKETIKLFNEAIEKLDKRIADEEKKEEPEMDPYDLLKLKTFRVDVERRREQSRDHLALAYEGMRIQLDLDPETKIRLDKECLHPLLASLGKEKDYVNASMELEPNVKLLDIGVDIKRRQHRLEKRKLLPKAGFAFFVDVGRTAQSITGLTLTDDFNNPFNYTRAGVGAQLKGTIDFHGAYSRIKKARAEYYKAAYERSMARRALALDVRKAYLEARRARDNVGRTKKENSMANQMLFLSKMNIDVGIGDQDKYAEALTLVLLTRGQYLKSVFEYNLALADLERRIGMAKYEELTPPLHVREYEAFDEGEEDWGETFYDEEVGDVESENE
jgi:outer membrane protein TolC